MDYISKGAKLELNPTVLTPKSACTGLGYTCVSTPIQQCRGSAWTSHAVVISWKRKCGSTLSPVWSIYGQCKFNHKEILVILQTGGIVNIC